ncbi:hypothetical protein AKJ16_DCAP13423 [Drosera capensis]
MSPPIDGFIQAELKILPSVARRWRCSSCSDSHVAETIHQIDNGKRGAQNTDTCTVDSKKRINE